LQITGQTPEYLTASLGGGWAAYGLAGLACVIGLTLWLAGGKILKPIIVFLFAMTGAAAGYVLLPMAPIGHEATPYAGAAIGLVTGAVLGAVAFRFAVAAGFGLTLAIAAPVAAAVVIGVQRPSPDHPAPALSLDQMFLRGVGREDNAPDKDLSPLQAETESLEAGVRDRIESLLEQIGTTREIAPADPSGPDAPEPAAPSSPNPSAGDPPTASLAVDHAQAFARAAMDEAQAAWSGLPDDHRTILSAAAIAGVTLGLLWGLLAPRWAAGAVTALIGSAIWFPIAAGFLTSPAGPDLTDSIDLRAGEWLAVWFGLAVIGTAIQWAATAKSKLARLNTEAA
jgi:hypothetical protein